MRIFKFFLPVFIFTMFSCAKEKPVATADDFEAIGEVIEMSQTFTAGDGTRANPVREFKLSATFNTTTEKVLSYKIVRIEDDLAYDLGISPEELDAMLKDALGEDFTDLETFAEQEEGIPGFSLSKCLSDCYDKFTSADGKRLPGRGSCKLGCWGDAVVEVIKIIADAFRDLSDVNLTIN